MIDAKTVKQVATKYIYDKCPAVAGIGKHDFIIHEGLYHFP